MPSESRFAGAGTDEVGATAPSQLSWTAPGNIVSDNDTDASGSFDNDEGLHRLRSSSYGFTIPADATIDGIEVEVEIHTNGSAVNLTDADAFLHKTGATPVGNDHAVGTQWPTTRTARTYGTPTDLWGTTWTYAEINASTFGFGIQPQTTGSAASPRVDYHKITVYYTDTLPAAALSGTAVPSATEAEIVAGGETIIITLTGATWIGAGSFDAQRQAIIDGLDSNGSETNGWNNEVRDKQGVSGVVRTSDTVVTITLNAQVGYNLDFPSETITVTVPASALASGGPLTATPTFDATYIWPPAGAAAETLHQVRSGLRW